MVKKGDSEKLKDASYGDGVVWSDVGYDVNGSHNGKFLPGSYAVGGGRGGMGVWADTSDGDEDDTEDASEQIPDPASNELTGSLYEIKKSNRKWQYVKQAVAKCPGQFHDRHLPYSTFVQGVLKKIFTNYNTLAKKNALAGSCSKCKDRAEKIAKHGIPTPYGMVNRLNGDSKRLMGFLDGHTWRINIFTSGWGQKYMEAVKNGVADAE
jgi:hypothetical protein